MSTFGRNIIAESRLVTARFAKNRLFIVLSFLVLIFIFSSSFSFAKNDIYARCNPNTATVYFEARSSLPDVLVFYRNSLSTLWNNKTLSLGTSDVSENRFNAYSFYYYNLTSGQKIGNQIDTVICANNNTFFHDIFYAFASNYTSYPTSCQPTNQDSINRFTCKVETIQAQNILAYIDAYKITNNSIYLEIALNLSFFNYTTGGSFDSCDHAKNDFYCNSTTEDFGINNFNGNISGSKKQASLIYALFSLYEVSKNTSVYTLALNYSSYPNHPEDCNPHFANFACASNESDALMSLAYSKAYLNTDDDSFLYYSRQFVANHLQNSEVFFCKPFYDLYRLTLNQTYKDAADRIASNNLLACYDGKCNMSEKIYLYSCIADYFSFNGNPHALASLSLLSYSNYSDSDKSVCNINSGNYSCVNSYYQAQFLSYYAKSFKTIFSNNDLFYDVKINTSPSFGDNVTVFFKFRGNSSNPVLYYKSEYAPSFLPITVNISKGYVLLPSDNLTVQGIYQYYFYDSNGRYPKTGYFTFVNTRHYKIFGMYYDNLFLADTSYTSTYPDCKIRGFSDYSCELEYFQSFMASSFAKGFILNNSQKGYLDNATTLLTSDFDVFSLYSTCNYAKNDYFCENNNENDQTYNESGLFRSSVLALSFFDIYSSSGNISYLISGLKYLETNKINNSNCDFISDFSCGDQKTQSMLLSSFFKAYLLTANLYYYDVAYNLSRELILMQNSTISLYAMSDFSRIANDSVTISKTYDLSNYAYSKCNVYDSCTPNEYAYSIMGLYSFSQTAQNRSLLNNAYTLSTNKRTSLSSCDPVLGDYNCQYADELALLRMAYMYSYESYPLSDNESYDVFITGINNTDFYHLINISCSVKNVGNFSNSNVDVYLNTPYRVVSYNTSATRKSDYQFTFSNIDSNQTVYVNWTLNATKGGFSDITCHVRENSSVISVFAGNIGHSFNSSGISTYGINFLENKTFVYSFRNIWDFTLYNVSFAVNISNLMIKDIISDGKGDINFSFNNITNRSDVFVFYSLLNPYESFYFGFNYSAISMTQDTSADFRVNGSFGVRDFFNTNGTVFYDVLSVSLQYFDVNNIYTNYWFDFNITNIKNYTLFNVSFLPSTDAGLNIVSKRNWYKINDVKQNSTVFNITLNSSTYHLLYDANFSLFDYQDDSPLYFNISQNDSKIIFKSSFLSDNGSYQAMEWYNDTLLIRHISNASLTFNVYANYGSSVVFLCNISSGASYKIDSCIMKTTSFSFANGENNLSIIINRTDGSNILGAVLGIDLLKIGVHRTLANITKGSFVGNRYFVSNLSINETVFFSYKYFTNKTEPQFFNLSTYAEYGYNRTYFSNVTGNESVLSCVITIPLLNYSDNFSVFLNVSSTTDYNVTGIFLNYTFSDFNYISSLYTLSSYTPLYSVTYLGRLRPYNTLTIPSFFDKSKNVFRFDGNANQTGSISLSAYVIYYGKYSRSCSFSKNVAYVALPADTPNNDGGKKGGGSADVSFSSLINESGGITDTKRNDTSYKMSEDFVLNEIKKYGISENDINRTSLRDALNCTRVERIILNTSAMLRIYRDCDIDKDILILDSFRQIPDRILSPFYYVLNKNVILANITSYNGSASMIYYYNFSIDSSYFYKPIILVYNIPEVERAPFVYPVKNLDSIYIRLNSSIYLVSVLNDLVFGAFFNLILTVLLYYGIFLAVLLVLVIITHLTWFKNFVKLTCDDAYSLLKSANFHFINNNVEKSKAEYIDAQRKYNFVLAISFFEPRYVSDFLKELYQSTKLSFDFYNALFLIRKTQVEELRYVIENYKNKHDLFVSSSDQRKRSLLQNEMMIYKKMYDEKKKQHDDKINSLLSSYSGRIKYKDTYNAILKKFNLN